MLRFRTFGTIDLRSEDGERLNALLDQPKRLALLAILAAHQHAGPIRREKILPLLWPESSPPHARTALSTTLSRLRESLGDEVLTGRGTQTIGLSGAHFASDVAAFERAIQEDRFREAMDLYEGPFLDGFRPPGVRPLEDWIGRRRDDYRTRAYRAAMEAAGRARAKGNAAAAESCLRRAHEIDPLREAPVRELGELLSDRGEPAAAMQLLQAFRTRLEEEVGMSPSPEVARLADELGADARAGPTEETAGSAGPGRVGHRTDRHEDRGTEATDGQDEGTGPEPSEGSGPRDRAPSPPDSGRVPADTRFPIPRAFLALAAAAALVGGGAWLLYAAAGSGGSGPASPPAGAEASIAVLPFQISGSGAETWSDGMVTLLSTGLDGAAGIRAVSDRTVLSAWEENESGGPPGTDKAALEVARRLGVGYAVVGSAVALGGELRLSAGVHETGSGDQIGQVQVRGSPDSVANLADQLTGRVLGLLAEQTGARLRSADVASVTTRSLPALTAYLAGERHYRDADFAEAAEDYRRAISHDSAFALAHWRLASSMGWREAGSGAEFRRRAQRLAAQLPLRERRLLRATWLFREQEEYVTAVDSLRRLTVDYPDDPAVWYQLGEALFHGGHPPGWPGADRAFARAVELDPGHTPYYIHHVELAISVHRDSALAASRAAGTPKPDALRLRPGFPLAMDLVFGDPETRRRALARLDTVADPRELPGSRVAVPLLHPADQSTGEAVLRSWAEDSIPATLLIHNLLRRGRIADALRFLPRAPSNDVVACGLAEARALGFPIPDSVLDARLNPDTLGAETSLEHLLCTGVYLLERDRDEAVVRLLGRMRAIAGSQEESEPRRARARQAAAVLDGYRTWRHGELDRAAELLSSSILVPDRPWTSSRAIWRGDLYRELGDPRTAEEWYLGAWWHPLAHERLGRVYEKLERPADAAAAYQRFVDAWDGADSALQGRVRRARKRLNEVASAPTGDS